MIIALHLTQPDKASSFGSWLSKHAAIVRSITANVERPAREGYDELVRRQSQHTKIAAAWNCMVSALQQAALAADPGIVPAASHQRQQQLQQQLCLCSFSSNWVLDARVAEVLPAGSLTQLDLGLPFDVLYFPKEVRKVDGSALSSALARLSNLQQLRLAGSSAVKALPTTCMPGIAQLSLLTKLSLEGAWQGPDSGVALRARPHNAAVSDALKQLLQQPLPLRQLHLGFSGGYRPQELSLAALTQLTQLHIGPSVVGQAPVVLPVQLLQLKWGKCTARNVRSVVPLQQLQQLKLHVAFDDVRALVQLTQLQALTELALTYDDAEQMFETRSAWKQLPQLRELDLCRVVQHSRRQSGAIRRAVAACPGLKLKKGIASFFPDADTDLEATTEEESGFGEEDEDDDWD
jgi:hypothetical protein